MRTFISLMMFFCCAALAAAQDKTTVPLSDPSQPPTIKVHMITGSITVTAGSASQVVVESSSRTPGNNPPPPPVPPGMHRLDIPSTSLDVKEDHNVVSIESTNYGRGGNLTLQVPANSSLQLNTINGGHIEVTGVNGAFEVANINGSVTLKNISGSVVALSQNGSITVVLDKVSPDKPMSFTTLNGKIDVTLPADTKARLRVKTENGSVLSAFDVKMEPDTTKPGNGEMRLQNRNIYGSINGGGPEYRFESLNGSILIHKK